MTTNQPPTRRATYQDVIDAPAHRVAEIVAGRLYVSPRPPPLAALAKSHLRFALGPPFDRGRAGPGGWWILHEPELHFGEDVVVPDVTGWRRERMPELPTTDYVIRTGIVSQASNASSGGMASLPVHTSFGSTRFPHGWSATAGAGGA